MYEISLVPDVKAELLQKQKLRNLIIFICIIVAGACIAVILIMLSIMGAQSLSISGQEDEMSCRIEGKTVSSGGKCKDTGSPIMTFKNANELLTIQDQMKSLNVLNSNKVKFSRLFGVLDVILPDGSSGGDTVLVNELTTDISRSVISFDAIGKAENNIGYHALESFRKGLEKTYFDYGSYMRKDENGEYVAIPSFCIQEYTQKGYTYAKYYKGEPGCEAPMIESKKSSDGAVKDNDEDEDEPTDETKKIKKEVITIRRTYDNSEDMENYKNGNDSKKKDGDSKESVSGYYFESECLQYDEAGDFDEEATLETCPLLEEDGLMVGSSGYGKGEDDEMVLSFSVSLALDSRIFKVSSKHMLVFGPSRQNVTDSYVEVRDMFTPKAKSLGEEED